jgi:hypothetical protein
VPFKTFTASVLSSSDVNTYLMKQAVITCTSGTRPASPVEGMTIYETDTDLVAIYDGSAWGYLGGTISYTPTTANITLGTGGTVTGLYSKIGKTVTFQVIVTLGTSGVFGSSPTVTLPIAPAIATQDGLLFNAIGRDASGLASAAMGGEHTTSTTLLVRYLNTTTGLWTSASASTPFTWAVSDTFVVWGTYLTA